MKISKREDGKYVATAPELGKEEIVAETESRAILEAKEAIQKKQSADESKAPFRIIY